MTHKNYFHLVTKYVSHDVNFRRRCLKIWSTDSEMKPRGQEKFKMADKHHVTKNLKWQRWKPSDWIRIENKYIKDSRLRVMTQPLSGERTGFKGLRIIKRKVQCVHHYKEKVICLPTFSACQGNSPWKSLRRYISSDWSRGIS